MNWSGKRVLVTGAGGFIGSHLVERVVQLGARTRALVHYRAQGTWGWLDHSPCRKEIEVCAGDLMDRDCVFRAVKDQEVVFHLGALIAIPYSYQAPPFLCAHECRRDAECVAGRMSVGRRTLHSYFYQRSVRDREAGAHR